MSLDARSRLRTPYAAALDLPPPFRPIALREAGDAFAHATAIAAEEGAGTLVHVGRFDLVEFALVLEPDEPLGTARRAFYAGMAALAEALAAHAPPEKLIHIEWPDALFVDGALVGGARLAWPAGADEAAPADWLVFGAMVRTALMGGHEPGLRPDSAALADEGFEDLGAGRLIESFARHFMVQLDSWNEQGFAPVARTYLPYLGARSGIRSEIGATGDLVLRHAGKTECERRDLVEALRTAAWFDPETGSPRL
jgi:Biotin/lipoate A/B protein ligase family